MTRRTLTALLAIAGGLTFAAPAVADESPDGCGGSRFALDIVKDRTQIRVGETINYLVELSNTPGDACDVSNITINLYMPGDPGKVSATPLVLSNSARYNRGTPKISFGPFSHLVTAADAAASEVTAKVKVTGGVLHDAPIVHAVNIDKDVGTTIITPKITIDKVGSIEAGVGAQDVSYSFTVRNASSPPTTIDNVKVTDSLCPNVVGPVSGDDGDKRLQPAEVWVFTCTVNHGIGEWINTATACGDMVLNGVSALVCSPPDTWKVVLTPPPAVPAVKPPPQVVVKPTTAAQAPCTLARATKTTVRAGQLNTIRVRVRNIDAGSVVKITLPGGKVVSAKTDKSGVAVLKVRPTKSGTATIRAAECSDVERLSVKAARRVVAKRVPRVTG